MGEKIGLIFTVFYISEPETPLGFLIYLNLQFLLLEERRTDPCPCRKKPECQLLIVSVTVELSLSTKQELLLY